MTPTLLRVREKVIASVPEIVINPHAQLIGYDRKITYFQQCRPIQLADVLMAIQEKNPELSLVSGAPTGTIEFAKWNGESYPDTKIQTLGIYWDLTKPLDEQSPETIAFLDSILNTKV